jgi:DNA-binding response OmpR family regulator
MKIECNLLHPFVIFVCYTLLGGDFLLLYNKEIKVAMRVLVVEDNYQLNASLFKNLVREGYVVDSAYTGKEGQDLAEMVNYDVIILDILLPHKDGLAVCKALRAKQIDTPILFLTARDMVEDRIRGLDSGADDYLVKPFAMSELLARLRALLRRKSSQKSGQLVIDDLLLDPARHNSYDYMYCT